MGEKLSNIVDDSNKLIGLLKFSKKKHLESLQSGKLYLNNFQYYKDLEIKEKKKGQGDAFDLTVLMPNTDFEIKDPKTKQVILKGKGNASIESSEDYKRHVFCTTAITPNLLEVIDIESNVATTKLVLSDELKEKAIENFGDHVMLINAGKFNEKLEKFYDKTKMPIIRNIVDYKDMSVTHSSRVDAFNNGDISFYFQKDKFFEYQNEYRFVFPDMVSEEAETIDLGTLEDCTNIISTEEFINGEALFRLKLYNVN